MAGNSNGTLCQSDFDCLDNELCFSEYDWVWEYNASSKNLDGCLCNTWYAWTGPDCDELSVASYAIVIWNAVTVLLGLLNCSVLFVCALELKHRASLCTVTTTNTTLLFSFLASLNAAFWALIQVLSGALTKGDPLLPFESYQDIYKGRWNVLSHIVAPVASFFAALALLNISLMWIEVSIRSGRLTAMTKNKLVHTRRLVYFFQIVAVILGVVGAIVEKYKRQVVMGYFITPLVLAVIVTYLVGAYKLNKIISVAIHGSTNMYLRNRTESSTVEPEPVSSSQFSMSMGQDVEGRLQGNAGTEITAHVSPNEPSSPATSPRRSTKKLRSKSLVSMFTTKSNNSKKAKKQADNAPLIRTLNRIRNTAVLVSITLLLFWGCYIGLSIIDSRTHWKKLTRPETLSIPKAIHNGLMLSVILSQSVVTYYVFVSVMLKIANTA